LLVAKRTVFAPGRARRAPPPPDGPEPTSSMRPIPAVARMDDGDQHFEPGPPHVRFRKRGSPVKPHFTPVTDPSPRLVESVRPCAVRGCAGECTASARARFEIPAPCARFAAEAAADFNGKSGHKPKTEGRGHGLEPQGISRSVTPGRTAAPAHGFTHYMPGRKRVTNKLARERRRRVNAERLPPRARR